MTGIEDVLDPTDINIYRDLAGGLTTANVLHGSANPIGGKNAVIKLRWGKTRAEELLFEGAMPGIKFALGENPKDMRQFGQTGPRRYPITRAGVEFVIRDAFTRAKAYQARGATTKEESGRPGRRRAGARSAARAARGDPRGQASRARALLPRRRDPDAAATRRRWASRSDAAARARGLQGREGDLAAHGAGASSSPTGGDTRSKRKTRSRTTRRSWFARACSVSINSDSAEHARRLNTEAAKSVKWGGLSDDEAFALVTINPAKQLKIDNRVGSLEQGKDADVVIWSHHPLSSYAIVERTYIDGIVLRPDCRRAPADGHAQGEGRLLTPRSRTGARRRRTRRPETPEAGESATTPTETARPDEPTGMGNEHRSTQSTMGTRPPWAPRAP